jgi:hypothetical protein
MTFTNIFCINIAITKQYSFNSNSLYNTTFKYLSTLLMTLQGYINFEQ